MTWLIPYTFLPGVPKLSIPTVHEYRSEGRKTKLCLLYCEYTLIHSMFYQHKNHKSRPIWHIGPLNRWWLASVHTYFLKQSHKIYSLNPNKLRTPHCNLYWWQRHDKKGHSFNITAIPILEGIYVKGHELNNSDKAWTILLRVLLLWLLPSVMKFGLGGCWGC